MKPHLDFSGLDSLIPPIAAVFAKEKICRFKPLPLAASALLTIEMKRFFKQPGVLITESAALMDEMRRNLDAFAAEAEETILDYSPREDITDGKTSDLDRITTGERLRTLARLGNAFGYYPVNPDMQERRAHPGSAGGFAEARARPLQESFLINTCVQALMQKTISPATLKKYSLQLSSGQEYDPDRLTSWLERSGYEFVPLVQDRSQVARRGGLTDIWPPSEPHPVRLEFDGLKIESIRYFDPVDQRSFRKKEDIILPPASETIPTLEEHSTLDSLACYLPEETIFFWAEKYRPVFEKGTRQYNGIAYHADLHEKSCHDSGQMKLTVPFSKLTEIISKRPCRQCFSGVECFLSGDLPLIELGFQPVQNINLSPKSCLTPDPLIDGYENRRRLLAQLEEKARKGMDVHFFFGTQGALDHFRSTASAGLASACLGEAFGEARAESRHGRTKPGQNLFHLHLGAISDGFLHDELRLAVISEPGLLFRTKTMRRHSEIKAQRLAIRRAIAGETITDRINIEPGDLVVHVNHGIGKYLGLHEIVFKGKLQEVFAVEYAERAKLYVPVSQAHLLSRYVTAGGRKAKIHRLGGSQWPREKESAQNAIYDMAAALLETQALRETFTGFAFPADTAWQHDFEAAFPYEETEDQERAISEIKSDMESPAPMDRLICGDAGYGKTEVAMRAAFKAVLAGKQVVILVPTTVLALQHYEVFQQRMEDYPIRVELLCRFRSVAKQQRIVSELQKGTVDIVVGTHRLLQADLGFKDLGLIIIDEEQRFGVAHKEYLKHLKKLADVLTLTATPIPRTLYMSLTGARKISMIQTPPKMRLPIETIIAKNDDLLVREAILRELNRGGQVFYLHNRVATIDKVFGWLKKIIPEARIAVAHGQMSSRELAEKMHAFARGMFDVLLCTTIVESGVDLPNANTILIDRADRFGIADLYQLRGRVGRADRKAYAYLLTPVHGYLLDIARRRLGAIIEHSQLGSGFKLAMLDLEIRGAGNLLGTEQSGHIAAIGFDLYCQLLKRAIVHLKSSPPDQKREAISSYSGGRAGPRSKLGEQPACHARSVVPPRPHRLCGPTFFHSAMQPSEVEVNLDFIDLAAGNNDPGSSAFLPVSYIEDEQVRISIYRKIASAMTVDEIESLRDECRDRFGPRPESFERLLKIAAIRIRAAGKNISAVETREGRIMFSRRGEYLQIKNQFPRLHATDTDGKLEEITHWLGRI